MSPVEEDERQKSNNDPDIKSSTFDGELETAAKTGENDPNIINLEKMDLDTEGDEKFAVKIIRTQDEELIEIAYEEYKLLKSIEHKNIIKMHDAFLN